MQFLKTYEALSQEQLENRRKEALFKKEVWRLIPTEHQNILINARNSLASLRADVKQLAQSGNERSDLNKQVKQYVKIIRDLEKKYYDKYRDMFDILTSQTLADMNSKTGVFESKKLPF